MTGRRAPTRTGALAEAAAHRYAESRGLRVVARNYRCRGGEIDLVALEGPTLVVIEVRYRERAALVHPALTVTAAKRRRLCHATARFLQQHAVFGDHPLRFDVMALSGPLDAPRCEWLRGAFDANDVPALRW